MLVFEPKVSTLVSETRVGTSGGRAMGICVSGTRVETGGSPFGNAERTRICVCAGLLQVFRIRNWFSG